MGHVTSEAGRERARRAVAQRMEDIGLSGRRMSADVGISTNTIARFLNGDSWPRSAQLAAIERAMEWPSGALTEIANGGVVPEVIRRDGSGQGIADPGDGPATLSEAHEPDTITVSLAPGALDGLDPLSIAQVEAEARVAALRFLRELQVSRPRREEETTP